METSEKSATLLEMKDITKRFPGITANDRVNFELRTGEIHALLGENGAGKSTLMSILSGLYYPDEGDILIDGKPVTFHSPKDALTMGIGMIYQHFMLVESHTVAENVILGSPNCPFLLDRKRIEKEIEELSRKYHFDLSPVARIWQLSVGEQQRVEILKALYRKARILIMDEPTAVLTPQETRKLFATLKDLVAEGNSVIFITHKLEEVMSISDRVTVLNRGKVVSTVRTKETSIEELVKMMVGRDVSRCLRHGALPEGEAALEVEQLHAEGERGLPVLRGLTLDLKKGEIMGIAGVAGNGQKEFSEALCGLHKITSGKIRVCGEDVTGKNPRRINRAGVAFIPEDRLGMGLVPRLPAEDNMVLRGYWTAPFSKGTWLQENYIREFTARCIKEYEIIAPGGDAPVKSMSGGNLQKLLLSRELSSDPRVIVAVYPARGLDIGAVEFVHKKLLEARQNGAAILLISEDLDEILEVADRVAVMYEGRIMGSGPIPCNEATIEDIGLLMSGVDRTKSNADTN